MAQNRPDPRPRLRLAGTRGPGRRPGRGRGRFFKSMRTETHSRKGQTMTATPVTRRAGGKWPMRLESADWFPLYLCLSKDISSSRRTARAVSETRCAGTLLDSGLREAAHLSRSAARFRKPCGRSAGAIDE